MIHSFLTFDFMDRTLSVTIYWKAVEQHFTAVVILDLILSGVKGLMWFNHEAHKNMMFVFLGQKLKEAAQQQQFNR